MNLRLTLILLGLLLCWAEISEGGPQVVGFAAVDADGLGATTGGKGGRVFSASTFAELEELAVADEPAIVRVSGTISGSGMLRVGSNKTIIGDGPDAVLEGFGLHLSDVQNIIIRNLSFTGADDDAINVQSFAHHIWIDHCDLSDAYDGLVDIKRGSSWITVSWNHFRNHHKTCLLGHSDGNEKQDAGRLKVTYHHNWFDGTESRHPRVRFGECHVFNNLYDRVTGYGIASTEDANVLVEVNYFLDVDQTTLVGYAASGPGRLAETDNVFVNSGVPETAGSVFDPSTYYLYMPDSAMDVPAIVRAGAGVDGFVPTEADVAFVRGDCNDDGVVDISDAVCILIWLFAGGSTPGCLAVTNTNGEAGTDVSDATYLLNHLFGGGPRPVAPFPECDSGKLPADEATCETTPVNCHQ